MAEIDGIGIGDLTFDGATLSADGSSVQNYHDAWGRPMVRLSPAETASLRAALTPPPPPPLPESVWAADGSYKGYSAAHPRPATDPVGAPTSPWRTKAGAVMSNSGTLVSKLLEGISGPSQLEVGGYWDHPTYYATNTSPLVHLTCSTTWGKGNLDGRLIAIPSTAMPAPPTEGDRHIEVVLCEADCIRLGVVPGTTIECWGFSWTTQGAAAAFKSGRTGNIAGSLVGSWGAPTASGMDLAAGIIRAPEIAALSIEHPLFAVCLHANISTSFIPPAVASDGGGGLIPMGQRFKLAYTPTEVAGLSCNPVTKAIVAAVSDKGAIIGDGSGNRFGFRIESGVMYTSQGQPDAIKTALALHGITGNLDLQSGVDWKGRLRACA